MLGFQPGKHLRGGARWKCEGAHGCGAAGAGKTYTMEGTREDPGINYRTMRELFRHVLTSLPQQYCKLAHITGAHTLASLPIMLQFCCTQHDPPKCLLPA